MAVIAFSGSFRKNGNIELAVKMEEIPAALLQARRLGSNIQAALEKTKV
ncbi:MAG: hypothetical protein ACOY9Y_12670 [Bacillota bacterium]